VAGPAQINGPNPSQQELGRSRPKMDRADLGPERGRVLLWAGLGPGLKAGPESVWPRKGKNEEGNYFPLPSPACRTIFRSACRRLTTGSRKRRITWRGGGGALRVWRSWRRRLVAYGRRQWRCCFQWRRGRFFLFPCPSFPFPFVFSPFFFLFGLLSPFLPLSFGSLFLLLPFSLFRFFPSPTFGSSPLFWLC